MLLFFFFFFFSSRRRHTRFDCDWSSDVCSSDLVLALRAASSGIFTDHVSSRPERWFTPQQPAWSHSVRSFVSASLTFTATAPVNPARASSDKTFTSPLMIPVLESRTFLVCTQNDPFPGPLPTRFFISGTLMGNRTKRASCPSALSHTG